MIRTSPLTMLAAAAALAAGGALVPASAFAAPTPSHTVADNCSTLNRGCGPFGPGNNTPPKSDQNTNRPDSGFGTTAGDGTE